MRSQTPLALTLAVGVVTIFGRVAIAQTDETPKGSPVRLELSMEVATTTEEGYPSALRITLKNLGSVPVDLPLAPSACEPDGGVEIEMTWIPDDPRAKGTGWGHGCGSGDLPPLRDRVRDDYVRLRPGEYVAFTESMRDRFSGLKGGKLEYWVEFAPPTATTKQVGELLAAGYVIPTVKLASVHRMFAIR